MAIATLAALVRLPAGNEGEVNAEAYISCDK